MGQQCLLMEPFPDRLQPLLDLLPHGLSEVLLELGQDGLESLR
jgi:hypothetical protein